ncbi:MAG: hypothetical protein ACLRX7_04005 [Acutalibacteraceae bacterium]
MTEKKRCWREELFYSPDEQLKEERLRAKELYDYTICVPMKRIKETLMKKLLGSIGQEFSIDSHFIVTTVITFILVLTSTPIRDVLC